MYGQRALCVGAVKPLNYVGTSLHTRNKRTPFRRITHTGGMFEAVFFGTRAEADRVLGVVDGMHERVIGALPEDAGPHYPARYALLGVRSRPDVVDGRRDRRFGRMVL